MSPLPGFVTNTIEKLFLRPAVVSRVSDLAGHFRIVQLSGDSLKGEAWKPGQALRVYLGNLTARTYTPISWNSVIGCAELLIFLHGNGPGSAWASSVRCGDLCKLTRLQNSLDFDAIDAPPIFFGDETSIGAAHALNFAINREQRSSFVFEVSSLVESEEVIRAIDLPNAKLVQKERNDEHLEEVEDNLLRASSRSEDAEWLFAGNAISIQTLRKRLRSRDVPMAKPKVKAYWAPGKVGLE
jgi:ferric-chelate reductase (NADPH)